LQNPQEMLIFVIPRTKNQSITVKGNNIALGFATASSQEGSTIETAVEIVRGDERSECKPGRAQPSRVVPEPHSLRMHSERFRLRNHPSRHRKERDNAALLTQEGNSPAFTVYIILCAELIGHPYGLTPSDTGREIWITISREFRG
jgi:hypothetical protein